MHELQITESILGVVLRHAAQHDVRKVVRIHLRVGELSDLVDEWIQHYFDYLSRGTPAEGAQLAIVRSPIVVRCAACGRSFEVDKDDLGAVACPDCAGSRLELVSGRGYFIENMEVL
ncbi:MAG: hydrogenase maturation nickel metallochaperone HypA [Deltaproteobacteria bacterium]|nr:hydrogenase maturation nickel metallochaperone HypA [Deltaproteobacteria bacterium]